MKRLLFFQGELAEGLEHPVAPSETVVIRDRYGEFMYLQLSRYDRVAQQVALALLPNLEVVVVSSTAEDDHEGGLATMALEQGEPGYLAPVRSAPTSVRTHLRALAIEDVVSAGRTYQQDPALFRLPHFSDLIKQSPNLEDLVFNTTTSTEGNRPLNNDELSIPLAGIQSITVHGRGVGRLVGSGKASPQPYLEKLIERCPRLERLSVRAKTEQIDEWENRSDFSPLRTIQDVWAVRKTLTQLALYLSYVKVSGQVRQTGLGAILHEFTALESLVINEQCFCTHWPHVEDTDEISQRTSDERPFCLTSTLPQSVIRLTV